jgi:hypothetical protein
MTIDFFLARTIRCSFRLRGAVGCSRAGRPRETSGRAVSGAGARENKPYCETSHYLIDCRDPGLRCAGDGGGKAGPAREVEHG